MNIHLLSVVGGRVSTLGPMLDHYLALGVDSVLLFAHAKSKDDPILSEIAATAKSRGIAIDDTIVGDWDKVQFRIINGIAAAPRDQWYLIADQDEFQHYPTPLKEVIAECELRGFDYVRGCFVDRFSAEGLLSPINPSRALSAQFPMGSFFTRPILGGSPMKVVAARGGTGFTNFGHHHASNGFACPPELHFVQVHHYKWTDGLLPYLAERSNALSGPSAVTGEDRRFERYLRHNGDRIDFLDPGILAAPCEPTYPHWDTVRTLCLMREHWQRINGYLRDTET